MTHFNGQMSSGGVVLQAEEQLGRRARAAARGRGVGAREAARLRARRARRHHRGDGRGARQHAGHGVVEVQFGQLKGILTIIDLLS